MQKKESEMLSCVRLFVTLWTVVCPWDFQARIHFLLQGIFPTQGSNPDLSHCRQMLYSLSHQGKHWESSKTDSPKFFYLFLVHTLLHFSKTPQSPNAVVPREGSSSVHILGNDQDEKDGNYIVLVWKLDILPDHSWPSFFPDSSVKQSTRYIFWVAAWPKDGIGDWDLIWV